MVVLSSRYDCASIGVAHRLDIEHRQDVSDRDPNSVVCHVASWTDAPAVAKGCSAGVEDFRVQGPVLHEAVGVEGEGVGVVRFVVEDCPENNLRLKSTRGKGNVPVVGYDDGPFG